MYQGATRELVFVVVGYATADGALIVAPPETKILTNEAALEHAGFEDFFSVLLLAGISGCGPG
jgi:hypothetical protein